MLDRHDRSQSAAPITLSRPLAPMLVRYGRLGDMVLQAPLLHLLRRRYGEPCKLLSFGPWSHELYAGSGDVQAIRQLRRRHSPYLLSPERWSLVKELRRHDGPIYVSEDIPVNVGRIRALLKRADVPADRCLFLDNSDLENFDLDNSDQSDSALRDSSLDRVGIDNSDMEEKLHWVDRLLAFGRMTPAAWSASDYPWRDDDLQLAPRLYVDKADRADCHSWLAGKGLATARIVLLQPGNKRTSRRLASRQRDSKAWPVERWAALIHAIRASDANIRVVLCGAGPEQSLLEEIRVSSAFADTVIATKDLPLRRLLALTEVAHSMVGVDTGPLHVAAAVGCPVVVLYGAETPARWDRRSPFGSPVISLGGPPRARVDEIGLDEVVDAWRSIGQRDGAKDTRRAGLG